MVIYLKLYLNKVKVVFPQLNLEVAVKNFEILIPTVFFERGEESSSLNRLKPNDPYMGVVPHR